MDIRGYYGVYCLWAYANVAPRTGPTIGPAAPAASSTINASVRCSTEALPVMSDMTCDKVR